MKRKSKILKILPIVFLFLSCGVTASNIGTREHVIVLSRSSCFGTCPAYSITVFENGDFIFKGYKHVKRMGVFRGKYSDNPFPHALELLRNHKFEGFNSVYSYGKAQGCKEDWTDSPSVRIYLQIKGETKEVFHNHGCRGFEREKELTQLEGELDNVLDTKRWIKGR